MAFPVSYPTNRITLFISSVAERDNGLRTDLEKALFPLSQQGLITIWHDEKVSGGAQATLEISKHLEAAQIILLLLSGDSLACQNCYDQMVQAMERSERGEAIVIPVLLRPVVWQASPCGMLKPLPEDGKPIPSQRDRKDLALYKIADYVRSLALRLKNEPQKQPPIYRNIIKQPPLLKFMLKREQVVQDIYRHLTSSEVTALVLTGMGGCGKTELAKQVYHYTHEQLQSGEGPFIGKPLWFTIDETVTLIDLVGSLCEALGHPLPYFQSYTAGDLAVELFNLIHNADQPRVIVLDQFDIWLDPQTRQVRQEYPGLGEWLDTLTSRPCDSRILLTSRFQPRRTHQDQDAYVQKFEIKRLNATEGAQLLQMKLPHLKENEISLAVEHCQGHAQALALLRDLLCGNHSLSIHAVLNEPIYMNQWISDIATSILNQIYSQHLNQVQRELLLAFSIYREAVPLQAALVVFEARLHVSNGVLGQALHVLRHYSLLEDPGDLCYQLHPVVTDFMRMLQIDGNEQSDKQARRIIHARAAQYYREQLISDLSLIWEQQRPHTIHFLVETIWHLCQAGQQQDAYELICQADFFTYLHRQGSNSMLLDLYTQLIPLDEWQPDTSVAARISNEMGEIYNALGQKNQALQQYKQALQLFRKTGQTEGIVETLNNLGTVYRILEQEQGQYTRAMGCYQEALQICEESPERIAGRGITFNNLGKVTYEQAKQKQRRKPKESPEADYIQALTYYQQALALHQEAEFLGEEARTLNNMGEIYAVLQQTDNAHEYYWRALKCFRENGEQRGQGIVFNNLGVLYKNLNKKDIAQDYYIQALRIFREVGDLWEQGKAQRNLGHLYFLWQNGDPYERYTRCLACFLQVRDILEEIQNSQYEAIPLSIEDAIRQELGSQRFAQLRKEVEANSASIMEQVLTTTEPISGWSSHQAAYLDVTKNIRNVVTAQKTPQPRIITNNQLDTTSLEDKKAEIHRSETEKTIMTPSHLEYRLEDQPWYAPNFPLTAEIGEIQAKSFSSEIDVVIMTANDEELKAIMHKLKPYSRKRSILLAYIGPETYYLGKFGEFRAVVTKCRMGSAIDAGSVTLATNQAQEIWHPKAIIMVGVAFGKDAAKQKIGDVLVASQVIPYEAQRVGEQIIFRSPIPPSNPILLNRFENAPNWRFMHPDGQLCTLQIGPILSGEKLVDNPVFKSQLFQRFPQAIGGEMEGAGLCAASGRMGVAWILVKSICDWGDGTKQNLHQPLAAAAATSLVHHVLSQRTVLDSIRKS